MCLHARNATAAPFAPLKLHRRGGNRPSDALVVL